MVLSKIIKIDFTEIILMILYFFKKRDLKMLPYSQKNNVHLVDTMLEMYDFLAQSLDVNSNLYKFLAYYPHHAEKLAQISNKIQYHLNSSDGSLLEEYLHAFKQSIPTKGWSLLCYFNTRNQNLANFLNQNDVMATLKIIETDFKRNCSSTYVKLVETMMGMSSFFTQSLVTNSPLYKFLESHPYHAATFFEIAKQIQSHFNAHNGTTAEQYIHAFNQSIPSKGWSLLCYFNSCNPDLANFLNRNDVMGSLITIQKDLILATQEERKNKFRF